MKSCIDLHELYGEHFKTGYDKAVLTHPALKRDPWYFTIRCKYGAIFPHGGDILAVDIWSSHPRIRNRVKALDGVSVHIEAGDVTTLLFDIELFDSVAVLVKPYKRMKLTEEQKDKKRVQMKHARKFRYER